jgi:hypothetical protein
MPNKKCTRHMQELEARLRTAERVARTAIACMKSDASTFAIMRDVEWMQAPVSRGSNPCAPPPPII